MAGTTPRGYPFPHDLDPINVALDIELLAEAIDTDLTAALEDVGNSEQDAAQNAAIAALQTNLTNNFNQDATDRARMEAINTALDGRITANTNVDSTQQAAINSLQSTVNGLTGNMKVHAANVGVTLDAAGQARISIAGIFPTAPVVMASHNNLMGAANGLFWLDVKVGAVGNVEFLVQVAEAQTGNLFVNTSIIVSYIAVGTH